MFATFVRACVPDCSCPPVCLSSRWNIFPSIPFLRLIAYNRNPRPSNASRRRAARRAFLFTRPMVGDARGRRRDMSARRAAAADDSDSCHGDVGVGTLGTPRPGDRSDRTSRRGRRALIVSSKFPPWSLLPSRSDEGRCEVRGARCDRLASAEPSFRPSLFGCASCARVAPLAALRSAYRTRGVRSILYFHLPFFPSRTSFLPFARRSEVRAFVGAFAPDG